MSEVYATGGEVRVEGNRVAHRLLVTPAVAGPHNGLVRRIGDWTWDVAHRVTGVNPYRAANPAGDPAYLSFCYLRVRACGGWHLRSLRFGDVLDVVSSAFHVGPGALYAAHRIGTEIPADPFDATAPGLLAETYNRWVSREAEGSNESLVKAAPDAWSTATLPQLPPARHPRGPLRIARELGSFVAADARPDPVLPPGTYRHVVDPVHDINGVDLLYFASWFSIVDHALLGAWLAAGGTHAGYLARRVRDVRVACFGNADAGATLDIWHALRRDGVEWTFDATIRRADGTLVGVGTVEFQG